MMRLSQIVAVVIAGVLAGCSGSDDGGASLPWTAAVALDDAALLSFWGGSADDVFAVGGTMREGGGAAIVLHHGADGWQRVAIDVPTLWWVHGFDASDVWAVGELGTIVHFDGASWTTLQTGAAYTLWGIWGQTPTDLWAVGGTLGDSTAPSTMLHYDGARWTEVAGVGVAGELLFKVWGAAANDIWAVGQKGALLHYDGAAWTRLPPIVNQPLLTVRGRAADDVYAVGGVATITVLHYDGATWSELATGLEGGGLMGVWTAPEQPVIVAGFTGMIAIDDGAGFVRQQTPRADDLHATWGDGQGSYLCGGGNLLTIGARKGVVLATGAIAGDAGVR